MAPRMKLATLAVAFAPALLGGCIARTAANVVTAPVRVASSAVDLATTSQSERDEARGREIRRREERLAQLQDEHDELMLDCQDGNRNACREVVIVRQEIERLLPTIPYEPEEED